MAGNTIKSNFAVCYWSIFPPFWSILKYLNNNWIYDILYDADGPFKLHNEIFLTDTKYIYLITVLKHMFQVSVHYMSILFWGETYDFKMLQFWLHYISVKVPVTYYFEVEVNQ